MRSSPRTKTATFERDSAHRRHACAHRRVLARGSRAAAAETRTWCRSSRRRCGSARSTKRKGKIDAGQVAEPLRTHSSLWSTALIDADADEGMSTDELMGVCGLASGGRSTSAVRPEQLGIASNDTALTAYVHVGVERSSKKRLREGAALESALIDSAARGSTRSGARRGLAPAPAPRHPATERRRPCVDALPETVRQLLSSLADDGRDEDGGDAAACGCAA